eukprot:1118958-Pyramimonas_sp.AAC.1
MPRGRGGSGPELGGGPKTGALGGQHLIDYGRAYTSGRTSKSNALASREPLDIPRRTACTGCAS